MKLLDLNRQTRKLSNFSSAVGDGHIDPGEISGLGWDLFGSALDFMGYSNEAAAEAAELQVSEYENAYSTVTQEQYLNSDALMARATLYFDQETGMLDSERMRQEFYEEALEEYVQREIGTLKHITYETI